MCSKVIQIGLSLIVATLGTDAYAIDTSTEENICKEIGFKQRTEKFANCVLELHDRKTSEASSSRPENASAAEDGQICRKYGFKPGSNGYSECLMKIDMARLDALKDRERYERELAVYNQQLAENKRERDRQRALKQLELGLRMMGGQSIGEAARSVGTGAPIMPPRPAIQNQTITLPGARSIHCTTVGTVTNCM